MKYAQIFVMKFWNPFIILSAIRLDVFSIIQNYQLDNNVISWQYVKR